MELKRKMVRQAHHDGVGAQAHEGALAQAHHDGALASSDKKKPEASCQKPEAFPKPEALPKLNKPSIPLLMPALLRQYQSLGYVPRM